ncbi:uncharacterized protein LOC132057631 [Lycium ferocissimum]|uniref:uncharacterized protein LOC132057631 n=1 Tax=Lycium ferocissimum TaxID=112874 RepID=UPI002814F2FF|nr:uncharacterized protein LOC132057631 [Lycium ferocissimum]
MNFYTGGSSNNNDENSSSSSSSLDLDDTIAEEQQVILQNIRMNNYMSQYLQEYQNNGVFRVGSVPGHLVINRDREAADNNLFLDYFSDNPRYNDGMFRRRYRMSRNLFLRIVDAIKAHDTYFEQRLDAMVDLVYHRTKNHNFVFRMLAYGLPADATDEYVKIGESTAIESMKRFCRAIVEVFGQQYLRSPIANDVARLLHIGEQRGFPGMLGSLDCMHWRWKSCPTKTGRTICIVVDPQQ